MLGKRLIRGLRYSAVLLLLAQLLYRRTARTHMQIQQ